jgi:hypothetical protein
MSGDWETVPRRATRPAPSPERVCAVGTVTGAVKSPRLVGRPPKASGPETFAQRKGSGRVAGGLCSAFGAHFSGKIQRAGAIFGPRATEFERKMGLEGADGQAPAQIRRPRRVCAARVSESRPRSVSGRALWSGGIKCRPPTDAAEDLPLPQCARAEAAPFRGAEPCGRFSGAAGRRAGRRRSSRGPLCPKGTGPRERRGPTSKSRGEAEASERMRASTTRSPAVDPDHEVCRDDGGARKASPRRRPRHAASAAGLWPKRGRPSPERREAERGSTPAARSAAPRGAEQGRTRSGGAKGAAYRGLGLVAAAGGRKAGLWGEAGAGGQARPRNGGLRKAGAKGEARPRRGGKGLWAFTSAIAWHSRGQRRF